MHKGQLGIPFSPNEKEEEVAQKSSGVVAIDGNHILEQQQKTFETLEDLKVRMSKLEGMFSQILMRMDNIGSDVKQIKE